MVLWLAMPSLHIQGYIALTRIPKNAVGVSPVGLLRIDSAIMAAISFDPSKRLSTLVIIVLNVLHYEDVIEG